MCVRFSLNAVNVCRCTIIVCTASKCTLLNSKQTISFSCLLGKRSKRHKQRAHITINIIEDRIHFGTHNDFLFIDVTKKSYSNFKCPLISIQFLPQCPTVFLSILFLSSLFSVFIQSALFAYMLCCKIECASVHPRKTRKKVGKSKMIALN